jgi:cytochrome c5
MSTHFPGSARTVASAAAFAVLVGAATGWTTAAAQKTERSGKQVVDSLCVSCHGTGAGGAPRIGDKKAWSARAEKGLIALSQSALQGIRQMPAHGGNPTLTDTELERAITYMVNQSGGHWTEPVSRVSKAPERTGKQIVEMQCVKCHGTGVNGAPKIGDRAAWTPRVKQGFDVVVRSAIHGHGAMPARGGMADLTDTEIRSAITYMLNAGTGGPS